MFRKNPSQQAPKSEPCKECARRERLSGRINFPREAPLGGPIPTIEQIEKALGDPFCSVVLRSRHDIVLTAFTFDGLGTPPPNHETGSVYNQGTLVQLGGYIGRRFLEEIEIINKPRPIYRLKSDHSKLLVPVYQWQDTGSRKFIDSGRHSLDRLPSEVEPVPLEEIIDAWRTWNNEGGSPYA